MAETTRDANENFELLAAAFYRETGLHAPGKDIPAALGESESAYRERFDAWWTWLRERKEQGNASSNTPLQRGPSTGGNP